MSEFVDNYDPSRSLKEGVELRRDGDRMAQFNETQTYTNVPHLVIHHSPSGFEWGYSGSGPADLSLNILEWYLRDMNFYDPIDGRVECFKGYCFKMAWFLHQKFKAQFIAPMPDHGGVISAEDIKRWINKELASFQNFFNNHFTD